MRVGGIEKLSKIVQRAVARMNTAVVRNVISELLLREGEQVGELLDADAERVLFQPGLDLAHALSGGLEQVGQLRHDEGDRAREDAEEHRQTEHERQQGRQSGRQSDPAESIRQRGEQRGREQREDDRDDDDRERGRHVAEQGEDDRDPDQRPGAAPDPPQPSWFGWAARGHGGSVLGTVAGGLVLLLGHVGSVVVGPATVGRVRARACGATRSVVRPGPTSRVVSRLGHARDLTERGRRA